MCVSAFVRVRMRACASACSSVCACLYVRVQLAVRKCVCTFFNYRKQITSTLIAYPLNLKI